jgi:alkyldihydroxyacetonephosphate synthase
MADRQRSYWGWGWVDAALTDARRQQLSMLMSTQFDVASLQPLAPRAVEALPLPPCRIRAPAALAACCSNDPHARASHTYGQAFRDLVRALEGRFEPAPDLVAYPDDEHAVVALLDWCSERGYAAIPYGGGTSVVGGVEARMRDEVAGVVSIDLSRMSGVSEIDVTSRAALIEAGSYGPALEAELAPHGLSLRHYPQSFEFSTLGGWLATRAGGHFATLYTHIDDLLESMTVVTPSGRVETRRLPGSGAGPSPDRLFLGSEGALGIIVRAWMRLQSRPTFRASSSVRFADLYRAAEAARGIAQAGLYPSNCRLLDAMESMINGVGDGSSSYLLIAFESHDHELGPWLSRALEIARDAGGVEANGVEANEERAASASSALVDGDDGSAASRWRKMFLRAPYMRDALVQLGTVTETFETAITWDRFEPFHRSVMQTAHDALGRVCGGGVVTGRVTHVYPDGLAPYFTVIAPAKAGSQVAQWDEIKAAVSEAILAGGGTITHHHAVGRDHRPWYDRQRPEPFGRALAAVKRELDPAGILNPGVLVG